MIPSITFTPSLPISPKKAITKRSTPKIATLLEDQFISSKKEPLNHSAGQKFAGFRLTALADNGRPLLAHQLYEAVQRDINPYYGQVPQDLKRTLGCAAWFRPKNPFLVLDSLAQELAYHPLPQGSAELYSPYTRKWIQVTYLGSGTSGRTYLLNGKRANFVLKILRSSARETMAPYEEVANGAFYKAQALQDVSRLYAANPTMGWSLMEYIGPYNYSYRLQGRTLDSAGITSSDDIENPAGNRINGMLVDHGGIVSAPWYPHMNPLEFNHALGLYGLWQYPF